MSDDKLVGVFRDAENWRSQIMIKTLKMWHQEGIEGNDLFNLPMSIIIHLVRLNGYTYEEFSGMMLECLGDLKGAFEEGGKDEEK